MGPGYPLLLDLEGRRVLVVGGGPVAARRAGGCLDAGAQVVLVAPEVSDDVEASAGRPGLEVRRRAAVSDDLDGCVLVHTCTGVPAVDDEVAAQARARGVPCVRADDSARSDAWVPAVRRRDDVVVAVTAGGDPRRASRLAAAVATALDVGDLPLRHVRTSPRGSVALVGGGPGDPGLITVRGRRLLARADVVVADRLGPRALLDELDDDVEVVDVGKAAGRGPSQADINQVLVDRALAGHRVVRLKGGDPFLFGRGAEEALACARADVPVEVVPGVTSAFAAPALAGVPVTRRGVSPSVSVVSGHLADGAQSRDHLTALARAGGTLVVLMALGRLDDVAAALLDAGRPRSTPAVVVRAASTAEQEVVRTTLGDLPADAAHLSAPAVVLVGEVAAAQQG